jgi:hypothetical protein
MAKALYSWHTHPSEWGAVGATLRWFSKKLPTMRKLKVFYRVGQNELMSDFWLLFKFFLDKHVFYI